MHMKLVSFLFLLCLPALLGAESISPDTLLSRLKLEGPEHFPAKYSPSITPILKDATAPEENKFLQVGILAAAYKAQPDTAQWQTLLQWLTTQKLKSTQQHAVLQFLYDKGGEFITQRAVYLSFQQLGMILAKTWNEPRVEFAFLENCMGLELFSKNSEEKGKLIEAMIAVSTGSPYLELRTTFHLAEYYRTLRHDSCAYFFEEYISGIKPFLGKPNPYFLQETDWIQKADSGMLASAYRGYAVYTLTKGEIKKAGELLVLAEQAIPDTTAYDVRKIENQISLSGLYADLVNKEKTLEYALKAIARCDKYQYTKLRNGRVAAAYARALMVNEQYPEAVVEFERAYTHQLSGLSTLDPKRQALSLAILSTYMNDIAKARQWIEKAEALAVEPNDEVDYLTTTALGLIDTYAHQPASAFHYLTKARHLAEKTKNVRWLHESLYHFYLLHKTNGHTAESLYALEKFIDYNDSLYRSGQQLALFDIEASYQKTLQDETIARLDAEKQIAASRLKAQQRNLLVLIAGLIVTFLLLGVVWRLYKKVKTSNAIISKSIEEKNILLREIHHRVKNNLQVISSLLKLQSGYIKDDAAIQAIAEGRSRVQSMALLHQNLYKEDNLTGVNMKEYFDTLIQGLFDTYNISSDRIKLHKQIEEINLDVDTVVPLGLITNELISNALKHAFPGATTGNLYVELYEADGNLILKVRDDGTGLSAAASQEGFGSKLIQSLSQKLEADITTRSTHGTEVMLTIREYRKAA